MIYQDDGYQLDYDQLKACHQNIELKTLTINHRQMIQTKNKSNNSVKKKQENNERFFKRIRKRFLERSLRRNKIIEKNLEQSQPLSLIQDFNYEYLLETSCESQISKLDFNCAINTKAAVCFLKLDKNISKSRNVNAI